MKETFYKFRLVFETTITASSEEEAYDDGCEIASDMLGNGLFDLCKVKVKIASKTDLKKLKDEGKRMVEHKPEPEPKKYAQVIIGKNVKMNRR